MINVEVPVRTAAAVRQVLFDGQKIYTHDEDTTPERIKEIRGVIQQLDEGIEAALKTLEEQIEKGSEE